MLTDCVIEDNSAARGGGLADWAGYAAINGCTIADNVANLGGGILLQSGAVTLTNSTITGSSDSTASGSRGAAVDVTSGSGYTSACSMSVTNCTVANNPGGGIYVTAAPRLTLTLDNSIVALNNGNSSGTPDVSTLPIESLVASNDLIGVGSAGLTNGVNVNIVGTQATPIDPMLGPLQNNGGPTPTMALLPGSPAIGAGSGALAVDANGNPLTTDQRGEPRIVDGTVDIGAYEAQQEATTTTVTASPTTSVSGQSVTLTATVTPQAGSAVPVGSIQFEIDGDIFGNPVPLVDGTATGPAINSLSIGEPHDLGGLHERLRSTSATAWEALPSRSRPPRCPTSSP